MPNPAWVGRLSLSHLAHGAAFLQGLTRLTVKAEEQGPRKERCFIPESLRRNNSRCTIDAPSCAGIGAGTALAGVLRHDHSSRRKTI